MYRIARYCPIVILFIIILLPSLKAGGEELYPVTKSSLEFTQEVSGDSSPRGDLPQHLSLNFKMALEHYPELQNTKIRFRYASLKTSMCTRPALFSLLFRKRENVTWVIRINNSGKEGKVRCEDAGFSARTGLIGHELAHVLDFRESGIGGVITRAVEYLSIEKRRKFEYEIDRITIAHGLGKEVHDWSYYVLYESQASGKYRKYKERVYMSPAEIKEYTNQLTGITLKEIADN